MRRVVYEEKHTKRAWIEADTKKEAKEKIREGEQPIQSEDLLEVDPVLSSVEEADYDSIPIPYDYDDREFLLQCIDDARLRAKVQSVMKG